MESTTPGRGVRGRVRGSGRPRGSGAGRGRGSGALVLRSLELAVPFPSAEPQPSTSAEPQRSLDKRNKSRLSVEQRDKLKEILSGKEVSNFLMPDAPPKKPRKNSPERIPCPLAPGTSAVPPPHIPQPWELRRRASTPSKPSGLWRYAVPDQQEQKQQLQEHDTTPNMEKNLPPVFTPSMEVVVIGDEVETDEANIIDSQIEFIGFTPDSFKAASPIATTSRVESIPDSSSSTGFDPAVDDLEWVPDSGSELDDDEQPTAASERAAELVAVDIDELPAELQAALSEMDHRDDGVLREQATEDMLDFNWSNDINVFTGLREDFTGQAGPTFVTAGMSAFQILQKIWDFDIMSKIAHETNRYAADLLSNPTLSRRARVREWVPTTVSELWTFFGIIMFQSIISISVEKEYWAPCVPYMKLGNFKELMSLHRFYLLKKCLHFANNHLFSGNHNKLAKISPIIDHLNSKFASLYLPEQEIAIDESLLFWKGRLSFAQLIATKVARVGIKSYELCESRTGYLWKMFIYAGKNRDVVEESPQARSDSESEGATSQIVYNLVRPLLYKGHTLVMDNFYNSPLLSRTLKTQKTDTMGTLRLHREFVPSSLKFKNKTNMRPGEVSCSNTRDLTICVWRDSNVVAMISTFHKTEISGKLKHGNYKYKPKVVLDYNLVMGGVDKKDQLLQAFPVERIRNSVWYKKLFRRLLNVSIHNTFIIFNHGRSSIPTRQFRIQLADEIIKTFRPLKVAPVLPPPSGHFPIKSEKKKARCKLCALHGIDARSTWMCDTCKIGLCLPKCFKDYHT